MRKIYIALLLFTFAGFVASLLMSRLHMKLEQGAGFEERSFCTISEVVDCDTAIASRYARIAGIPTAYLGSLYYLFVLFATFYAWAVEQGRKATVSFLMAGSALATLYSIVLAYFAFYQLRIVCLLCTTTYLVNLAHLLLFPRVLEVRWHRIPVYLWEYLKSIFGLGAIQTKILPHLAIFLLVMGGGVFFFRGLAKGADERKISEVKVPDEAVLKYFYAQTPIEFQLREAVSRGPEKAKVTIVDFSDFQCPFCKRAAFTLKPYLGELKSQVRLIYVNYPLDNACNPAIQRPFHPVSCLAAKAALCAQGQGKFWEYHDLVFENQKRLSRTTLLQLANQAGLDETTFNNCLVSLETENRLGQEIKEAERFGVRGTPALFVNGRPLSNWTDPHVFRLVVESELKQP